MNIKEKLGDLLIDIAKLIIGGVLLASIISENINTKLLYVGGTILVIMLVLLGFYIYKSKNRRN
jgi:uncharacterized membrane protein YraQ (UPF0718 family)